MDMKYMEGNRKNKEAFESWHGAESNGERIQILASGLSETRRFTYVLAGQPTQSTKLTNQKLAWQAACANQNASPNKHMQTQQSVA